METGFSLGSNMGKRLRQLSQAKTLLHMAQNPDKVYRGILVDKRDDRGTVLIPELAIDVKLRRMADDPLGQELSVQFTRMDLPAMMFWCRRVEPPREFIS